MTIVKGRKREPHAARRPARAVPRLDRVQATTDHPTGPGVHRGQHRGLRRRALLPARRDAARHRPAAGGGHAAQPARAADPGQRPAGRRGLAVRRKEDGTLLRAKALPQGMIGYLVGRIVSLSFSTVASLVLMLVAGLFFVPGLFGIGLGNWLTIAWLTVLGLLSALPLGAVIGSLAGSPQTAAGMSMLAIGGLTAVSGVFYPITALAGWLQALAHVFPLYWLGLGMRSALLPDAAAAAEIGGSWRPVETTLVLLAWAVAGLVLAPPILRRMARRESGSAMEQRRHRAMQRVT
ncbi:ABC transporter permease [Nonomuraea antimicrobica]